ncbi:MAG: alpha-galactosidase [Rhodoglobus sp.]
MNRGSIHHVRAAGVSLVIDSTGEIPVVLHWGHDLGPVDSDALDILRGVVQTALLNDSPDTIRVLSIWPNAREGWVGTPAIEGHIGSLNLTPRVRLVDERVTIAEHGGGSLEFELDDDSAGLRTVVSYELDPAGLLRVRSRVERIQQIGVDLCDLSAVTVSMPLPARATEILDFTGKWARERSPQRSSVVDGAHTRELRRGKPGADSPYLLMVGTDGYGSRHGELWSLHVGFSGNQRWSVERHPEGAGHHSSLIGGGELLAPGEIRLALGEHYTTPWLYFSWSDEGMDGVAHRFHEHFRRASRHSNSPRPLTLNTWEAVYFDQSFEKIDELVTRAASIGVERFVLDDGWFLGRNSDSSGLGDWFVDEKVWPTGLAPLVDRVHSLGMQFGLWVEPEMLNLDSRLAAEHPDWILGPDVLGPSARNQYVLNVGNPHARAYLLERLDALVTEYAIDYLKWDHNRDVLEPIQRSGLVGSAGVHAQTLAVYSLMDELRSRHPGLEIESCAAGGGRIDLGMLERTDRVWASDTNDPVERLAIQRWTSLLLPLEVIGSHVGAARAHTTGRVTDLSFRLAVSLFAHAGIEWDITQCSDDELEVLRSWGGLYRELRPLLHTGTLVNADLADEQTSLIGVVSTGRSHGVFLWARRGTSAAGQSGAVRLPGLDESAIYSVRVRTEAGTASLQGREAPEWFTRALTDDVRVPGVILSRVGLAMPALEPGQAAVLELRA